MEDLTRLQWKKGRDGPATITCVRTDGSRTWAKLHPFLPLHDFLHYAVETTLRFHEAFFGLLATGWSIDDFGKPGAPASMPAEASWAESIVGLLDQERSSGRRWGAEEFNEALGAVFEEHGVPTFRTVTDQELGDIRVRFRALADRWRALAPGQTLELPFPVSTTGEGSPDTEFPPEPAPAPGPG